jgi:dienelactone hydrolase
MKTILIIILALIIASNLSAQVKVREAPYMQGETELQGKLVYDPLLKSIRSAVLVVHDMWGPDTSVYENAMKLAQLGHIVLIADLYGKDVKITSNDEAASQAESLLENKQLFIDRISAAMEFLKSQRKVDQGKIGVLGYGLGGNAALELALQGAYIAALVMYYPWLEYDMDEPPDYSIIKSSVLVFFGTGDPRLGDEGLVNLKSVFDQNRLDWQMVLYGGAVYGFTNKTLGFEVVDGMAFNYNADLRSFDTVRQFFTDLLK